jgi:hypothetical protein
MPDRDVKDETEQKKVEQLTEYARRWVASDEGQRRISTALESAAQATARLREARRVDPRALHDRITR